MGHIARARLLSVGLALTVLVTVAACGRTTGGSSSGTTIKGSDLTSSTLIQTTVAAIPTTTSTTPAPSTTVKKKAASTQSGSTKPKSSKTTRPPLSAEDVFPDPVDPVDNGAIDLDGVKHGDGYVERCGSFENRVVRYWVRYADGTTKTYRATFGSNSSYGHGILWDPYGNRLPKMTHVSTDPSMPFIECDTYVWKD